MVPLNGRGNLLPSAGMGFSACQRQANAELRCFAATMSRPVEQRDADIWGER
jgi:hypothetical protein